VNPSAARRLIIMAFMGFGSAAINVKTSGFRTKWSGSYVPCARTWSNYADCLPIFTERLQGVTLERKPAVHLLPQFDRPEALIYCDPPYLPETRSCMEKSCRYRYEMTEQDHRDLADVLRSTKAMVALSGYHSTLYDDLYGDWEQVCCEAVIERGAKRTEVLWLSPALTQRLHPTLF
jgi:DNA adenine methylase